MSLDAPGWPTAMPEEAPVAAAGSPGAGLAEALAALGPVLAVARLPPRAPLATAALSPLLVRIDSDGLDESFELDAGCRLFRLPDTDYLAWQRLAERLPDGLARPRQVLPWLRRAWVWWPDPAGGACTISLAGALRAIELARRERAWLAPAPLRGGTATPPAPPTSRPARSGR